MKTRFMIWAAAIMGGGLLAVLTFYLSSGSRSDSVSTGALVPALSRSGAQSQAVPTSDQVTVPASAPVPVVLSAMQPTAADYSKAKVLDEILKAKNDNDPRLDSEFNQLSAASKQLFRERYLALSMERRNERGTVVFLLGRNLTESKDVEFLGSVLAEPPCLSMADCAREEKSGEKGTVHDEMGVNISQEYPKMVALHAIDRALTQAEAGNRSALLPDMRRVVEGACNSPVGVVSEKAQALRDRLKSLGA